MEKSQVMGIERWYDENNASKADIGIHGEIPSNGN